MDSNVYVNTIKPFIDRLGALLLLIVFSPFILLCTLLILITMGRPLFFTQTRPGFQGKLFTIYKFRTMNNDTDEKGELLSDAQRLNGAGRWIRSLSLDELPQLLNVLKGEMSFIGPRPLLVEYLGLYSTEQALRHNVKPGITGWAQINGRNAISWEEKFRYDVEYVRKVSFGFDLKIILLTMKKVFKKEGISQQGEATMEKFRGTR
ncbi:MAG: sugar transferase [Sulfuricurvum sp.]|jgi:lipopolysaccharide/colanic/teichoic acid biosynthesis glycosyltransferase|uniref:sugar transferase n=1 Tax=Sulfuricurvum sp. TaxID=2025608 RepID=UPI0025FBC2D0|nr:sugar transferase [Sulfuricurvum sp.]MCK9374078.1 sugar transferase [Sulfuricurvum sp.]